MRDRTRSTLPPGGNAGQRRPPPWEALSRPPRSALPSPIGPTRRSFLTTLAATTLPLPALAQGFAGMASDAEGFTLPTPNPTFTFPQDHGPHPDFRIEWWYITANMTAPDGTPLGLQWTLFRSALAPTDGTGWNTPQVWFAHAAVTTADSHRTAERFARGGIGQAGVTPDPFNAWIDEWHLSGPDFDNLRLAANGTDFAYDVALVATAPLVFHGEGGYSVKSEQGQASYYYAQPSYDLSGTVTLPSGTIEVTGHAWLDREWSSQPLAENQSGWDWFSLTFDSGEKLMGYVLRHTDGDPWSVGTWIDPDGTATPLENGEFLATPLTTTDVDGREIPTEWHVQTPSYGVNLTVTALNPQAWMDMSVSYWEGPVTVQGSHSGVGYLEMTGYD